MNITRELHVLRTYHSQDKAFSFVKTAEKEDFFAPLLQLCSKGGDIFSFPDQAPILQFSQENSFSSNVRHD